MQSVANLTRINQIVILIGISFLFYVLTDWEQGIWVLISTVVVAGPFSTFLSYEKAKDRFLGTIVGLFVAFILEYYLRFNPAQLPVVAVGIAFIAGFMATRPYKYFIIMITVCTCMGYTYMNIPYTTFAPVSFLVDRGMGVFAGVLIFFVMQRFVFGNGNSRLELSEESQKTLESLKKSLLDYQHEPTLITAYQCAADIFQNTKDLKSYVESADLVFSTNVNQETCFARQVLTLNQRALNLLVDTHSVDLDRIDRLLQVVTLKLERQQRAQNTV